MHTTHSSDHRRRFLTFIVTRTRDTLSLSDPPVAGVFQKKHIFQKFLSFISNVAETLHAAWRFDLHIYCVWKNKYHQSNNRVDISLDFFEKQGKVYSRSKEHFSEISFEPNILKDILFEAGFKAVEIFDDLSFDSPKEDTQRIVVFAK